MGLGLFSRQAQAGTPADSIQAKHYRIYNALGESLSLDQLLMQLQTADVVFLGENHDDPVAHALEASIFQKLHEALKGTRPYALAMEQFERDAQVTLNEYLQGFIRERDLTKDGRAWNNYATDYKPMLEYAKAQQVPVIAGNAPNRYVSLTGRKGELALKDLGKEAKSWLAPLPLLPASEAYALKFNKLMEEQMGSGHVNPNMLAAQNLRDATMAHSVAGWLKKHKKGFVVHVNGSFHSEGRMGIPDHLSRYQKGIKMLVVTMQSHSTFPDFNAAQHARLGDFIILTDPSLPRTYKTSF